MSDFLVLDGLAKSFGDVQVLHDLSLSLAEGEILALLGLSGSGKTTALRLLAGFETPNRGRIVVAVEDVTAQRPAQRGFGMVFQHYALFPHMTVAQNIAFGLEAQGWEAHRRSERIATVLRLVDLGGFGERRVSEISGGQQQRVALARALAPEPRVLLLDEPLSNLDPSLRERTRRELRAAVRDIGITTVLVTHEQEEAFHVGDRVAVLHSGELQQVGSPQDLYRRPQRRFVATFVGRGSLLPGRIEAVGEARGDGDIEVQVGLESGVTWSALVGQPVEAGAAVDLIVRPESLELQSENLQSEDRDHQLMGDVVGGRFTGPATFCIVRLADGSEVEVLVENLPEVGTSVRVGLRQPRLEPRAFLRQADAG